mmetsp:Transcript_96264/g.257428  ORF Transcript_96264/g.257428 Transcript_96264/m.257428 type:complete len:222 (-) Transcript_96264:15-680(-)
MGMDSSFSSARDVDITAADLLREPPGYSIPIHMDEPDAERVVDHECWRAGLLGESLASSTWTTRPVRDMDVFWPNPVIAAARSLPFRAASGAAEDAMPQVLANKERLEGLWSLSSSHGISWDELDSLYVKFAQTGHARKKQWRDNYPQFLEEAQRRAGRRASRQPMARKEKTWRHLHFTRLKRQYLHHWRPGMLTRYMQQWVTCRMVRREMNERARLLIPK